jgi:hypothetical protein
LAKKIFTGNKKNTPRRETFSLARYMVIINDCSRSRPCPCYEIFAAFIFLGEKCGVDYFILFFFKLTIESKSIELFCTQFNSCVYKIKIKNVVHIIFVINFSTSLFINFFVYILQIIQKLNQA